MIDIEVHNLDCAFMQNKDTPIKVLEDLSFKVQKSEFIVILGESGCGKSTILQLLSGLMLPTAGEITVNGNPLSKPDPAISLLFQGSTLLPWLNVADNIQFGCRIRKDLKDLPNRVNKYLRMMNLEKYRSYYPQELSVGVSKRVDLARALIGNPKAMLLDEPFAPLDYYTKKRLLHELLSIWNKVQMTCVYVTHDIEEALQLGQKILIMNNDPGSIAYQMEVPLPYPRVVTDEVFIRLKKELLDEFSLVSNLLKSINDE